MKLHFSNKNKNSTKVISNAYRNLLIRAAAIKRLDSKFLLTRITQADLPYLLDLCGFEATEKTEVKLEDDRYGAFFLFDASEFSLTELDYAWYNAAVANYGGTADALLQQTGIREINVRDLIAYISYHSSDARIIKFHFSEVNDYLKAKPRLVGCFGAVAEGSGGKTTMLKAIAEATNGDYVLAGEPEIDAHPLHDAVALIIEALLSRIIVSYGLRNMLRIRMPAGVICLDSLREWVYRDSPQSTTLSSGINSGLLFALSNLSALCEQGNVLLVAGINPMNIKEGDTADGLIRALIGSMTGIIRVKPDLIKRDASGKLDTNESRVSIESRRINKRNAFEVKAAELPRLIGSAVHMDGQLNNRELALLRQLLRHTDSDEVGDTGNDEIISLIDLTFGEDKGMWATTVNKHTKSQNRNKTSTPDTLTDVITNNHKI